ncbi:MAG: pilus assembly protein PilM [Candidatus Wallbacteria bacterium]|nr:pilus assembly protein PilM [Candidatus Wallbacteria bacterium]
MNIKLSKLFKVEQSYIAFDPCGLSTRIIAFHLADNLIVLDTFKELPIKREDLLKQSSIDTLKEFIFANQLSKHHALFCVSGTNIILRNILLPKIPDEELPTAVHFEAKKELPFSLEEAEIDYHVLGEVQKDGGTKLKTLAVACKKEELDKYYRLFQALELKIHAIIVTPLLSDNLLELLGGEKPESVSAHIDIGYTNTSVNIFNSGILDFSRVIPMGSYHIDEIIAENLSDNPLQIPENMPKARALKQEHGITGGDERTTGLVREGINRLLQRVRLSIGYYKTNSAVKKIDRILLTGDLSELNGVPTFIGENLESRVELCAINKDHLITFASPSDANSLNANHFANALGTAIEAHPAKSRINLLPDKMRVKTEISLSSFEDIKYFYNLLAEMLEKIIPNPAVFFGFIYIGLIIMMIVPFLYIKSKTISYRSQAKESVKKLRIVNEQLEQAVGMRNEIRKLENESREKAHIFKGQQDWSDIFRELSHVMPEDTIVDELVFQLNKDREHSFSLTGKAQDASSATNTAIVLGKSPFFHGVNLENTILSEGAGKNEEKRKKLIFSLNGNLVSKNDE